MAAIVKLFHNWLETYCALKQNGISAVRPTYCGTTAGRNHQRPISTRITLSEPKQLHNTGADIQNLTQLPQAIPVRVKTRPPAQLISDSTSKANSDNLLTVPRSRTVESKHRLLKVGHLNPRSVKNKALSVQDFIVSQDLDILGLTETWLGTAVDRACLAELIPPGFDIKHVPRQDGRSGGGVAVIHKSTISLTVLQSSRDKVFSQFEYMDCQLSLASQTLRLAVVYRPPPSHANGLKTSAFLQEWPLFLERYVTVVCDTFITGTKTFILMTPGTPTHRTF